MGELLFLGIDIEKATRKFIDERIDELHINEMSDSERKAFDYGVNLVFQYIKLLTQLDEGENFVLLTDDEIGTEYTIEELIEMANRVN